MTSMQDAGPLPKFDNTLGALLLGGLAAMALWGITCVQAYTFLISKERLNLKLLVSSLWILDTFDSCLNCHLLYHYMVSNFLNPAALAAPVWSVIIHVAVTSISNFLIRSLFAHRVYRLSHGNIFATLWIMAVSMTDLVAGIVISARAFSISTYADLDQISNLFYVDFAAGTISDLSVAVSLCYLLHQSRTGFKVTDSIITVLMRYTVNTGLIVAVDAAIGMILYIVMPHNLIFLAFYLLLSKLYLNAYLATLNARGSLRDMIDEPVSINLTDITRRFNTTQSQSVPNSPTALTAFEKASPTLGNSSHSDRVEISVRSFVQRSVDEGDRRRISSKYDPDVRTV